MVAEKPRVEAVAGLANLEEDFEGDSMGFNFI